MTITTETPVSDVEVEPVADQAPDVFDADLRAQLAPWGAMGALIVAAGAARLAATATGAEQETALTVAGVAFTAAVVTAWATKSRMTSRRMRHRFVAALYLGAAWMSAVTWGGLSWGAIAALTILGSGLSLLWWREHRIGPGTPPREGPSTPTAYGMYVTRWAQNIGAKGKALAGSRLTKPEIIKAGYRYTLKLVPGVHTVAQAGNMPELLRGGLGLMPGQEVIVEAHPELAAPTAVLTVVTRSPVREPRTWPGPRKGFDSTNGSANLGPFVDDEGVAQWTTYRKDGIFGGYLQGGPGSGKSRMLESIAMSVGASESHPTVIWYGDGQNGDSSPMLVEHADYPATSFEQIYNMLQAAVRVMKLNGAENRALRRVGFTPTAERAGLLVIVDECHKPLSALENPLLAAATQLLMTTIAREGRKVGVALILASQSPTLDAFGGAGNLADTLRSCLLQGNGVILKSKTNNAKQVFGVDIDPRQFPKLPGYAFLSDPEEGARSAPFRGYWVTDEMAAVWPSRIKWRTLNRRQANMAGRVYERRREAAAEQQFQDEMLLQMADAGTLDDFLEMEGQLKATPRADTAEFGDNMPAVRKVEKFWTAPQQRTPAELTQGQQKVLDAIRAGQRRPGAIAKSTGYSESHVYNLIDELIKLERVRKVVPIGGKQGVYEPAEHAA